MTNGYIMLTRDRDDNGIYVETTYDWLDHMEEKNRRLLYCQAVSDVEQVQEKIDIWLEENQEELHQNYENINDQIAELVSSIQWIANEHPLQSFHHYVKEMFS